MAGDDAQTRTGRWVIGQSQIGFAGEDCVTHLVEWEHSDPDVNPWVTIEDAVQKPR